MTNPINSRALKSPTIDSITDAALKFLLGNRVMGVGAVLAIGSTPANVATAAITYMIGGQVYTKTAVAAGTAFTDVTSQADGTTRLYLVVIDTAGTISIINGEVLPSGGQPDDIVVPACPLDKCPLGVVKVVTSGAAFVPGTTSLAAGTVTDTYYNIGCAVKTVV
jgi:hypothetical protein